MPLHIRVRRGHLFLKHRVQTLSRAYDIRGTWVKFSILIIISLIQ